jgi:selenocysteine lyase/cysteine desulfurase
MSEGARKEEWLGHMEAVRARGAALLGADADEFAYVKSTSEGVNAFASGIDWRPGDNIIITPDLEHPNNIYPWLNLRHRGVEIRFAKAIDGQFAVSEIARLADRQTRVVVTAHVCFLNGARADLKGLADAAHAVGALLFVDAAQSVGLMDLDVHAADVDGLAACVHKGLLAPYGMGIFYCRKDLIPKLTPAYLARAGVDVPDSREFVMGDLNDVRLSSSARRFEFGSYNFPAIYAFGASLDLLHGWGTANVEQHVLALSRMIFTSLADAGFPLLSPAAETARSHLVCFREPAAESLAARFDEAGVRVSARLGVLRAAVGPYTRTADVTRFLKLLGQFKENRGLASL